MTPDTWTIVAALSAVAAAAVAAGQLWLSRRDANRRAALSYLERLDERVRPLWSIDPEAVQAEIIRRYRGEEDDLSPPALDYLSFLNALDLLAFAAEHGMVDQHLAARHVATLFRAKMVTATFLRELQYCCGDSGVYEDLFKYVIKHRELRFQSEIHMLDERPAARKPEPTHTPKPEIPPPPQRPPQPPRPEPRPPEPKPGRNWPPDEKGFPGSPPPKR